MLKPLHYRLSFIQPCWIRILNQQTGQLVLVLGIPWKSASESSVVDHSQAISVLTFQPLNVSQLNALLCWPPWLTRTRNLFLIKDRPGTLHRQGPPNRVHVIKRTTPYSQENDSVGIGSWTMFLVSGRWSLGLGTPPPYGSEARVDRRASGHSGGGPVLRLTDWRVSPGRPFGVTTQGGVSESGGFRGK